MDAMRSAITTALILGLAGTAWYQGRSTRLLREELNLQRRAWERYA